MSAVAEVDPFDLPDWVGIEEVTWSSESSCLGVGAVRGVLLGGSKRLDCDLLAADQAHPRPVLTDDWRTAAHRSWSHGQVAMLQVADRLTLAVPGTGFTADLVLEAVGRLARAVGARPERFTVALRAR